MLVMKGGSTTFGDALRPAMAISAPSFPWSAAGSIDVEALVIWALRDQRAGMSPTRGLFAAEASASGLTWHTSSSDGCAAIDRIGSVGCRIDVSGPGRDAVHPVADAVELAVALSPAADSLRHYGRLGTQPAWREPSRWLVPEAWKVEGVDAMWCYAERRSGAHCPLIPVFDADTRERQRAAYRQWWDGLELLAWELAGRALGFAVTGPAAAREPWLTIGA